MAFYVRACGGAVPQPAEPQKGKDNQRNFASEIDRLRKSRSSLATRLFDSSNSRGNGIFIRDSANYADYGSV